MNFRREMRRYLGTISFYFLNRLESSPIFPYGCIIIVVRFQATKRKSKNGNKKKHFFECRKLFLYKSLISLLHLLIIAHTFIY